MNREVIQRRAVRAVMLTPGRQVLLMSVQEPLSGRTFWITPGGGIEDGEDAEACLLREIQEETGVTDYRVGPPVWTRRHRFDWNGKSIDQQELYYVVYVDHFTPTMTDAKEMMVHRGFRWWSLEEIQASSDQFAPRELGYRLVELVANGPGGEPVDVGV